MRATRFLISTARETPATGGTSGQHLMLRAGMIHQLGAGLFGWLPMGMRVLRKAEAVVREEFEHMGAQEVLLPAVQPAALWQQSGRGQQLGNELLRLHDRHGRELCLAPAHEEAITELARHAVKSYRQLPLTLYQIRTAFRDEPRTHSGMLHAREFLAAHACSFHIDTAAIQDSRDLMLAACTRALTRLGLHFRVALADDPSLPATVHELHVLDEAGETTLAICGHCGYCARIESAMALPPVGRRLPAAEPMETVLTPGKHHIGEVAAHLGIAAGRIVKTLLVRSSGGAVALVVPGDHELNITKAERLPRVAKPLSFISPAEVRMAAGCDPGSVGPVGLGIPVIADESAARLADFVCGANRDGEHLLHVNWGRDLAEPEVADIRIAVDGDPCPGSTGASACGGQLYLVRSTGIGQVARPGNRYTVPLGVSCIDRNGNSVALESTSCLLGISAAVAAIAEQRQDRHGISWPHPIAPFSVCLVPVGMHQSRDVHDAAGQLYAELLAAGLDVLFDDRDERTGVMFADMDLIGIPHRLVVSARSLDSGTVEYRNRRSGRSCDLPLAEAAESLRSLLAASA